MIDDHIVDELLGDGRFPEDGDSAFDIRASVVPK